MLNIRNRQYDFVNFNTVDGNGTVGITVFVSPSLNANGDDRPLAIGVQVDDDEPQTTYFIPPAAPGSLPPQWDGNDGFAVRILMFAIHTVRRNADVPIGEHHR